MVYNLLAVSLTCTPSPFLSLPFPMRYKYTCDYDQGGRKFFWGEKENCMFNWDHINILFCNSFFFFFKI